MISRESITGCVDNTRSHDVLMCFAAGNVGFGTEQRHYPAVDTNNDGDIDDPEDWPATTTSTGTPNFVPGVTVRDDDDLLPEGSTMSGNRWNTNAIIVGTCAAGVLDEVPTFAADLILHVTGMFYPIAEHSLTTYEPQDKIAQFWHLGKVIDLKTPGFMVGYGLSGETDDGTSFPAPIVTGAAALVMSTNTDLAECEVRRILLDTADLKPFSGLGAIVGKGRLDAGKAVKMAKSLLDVPVYRLSHI